MKRATFLFLLAALLIPLFTSQVLPVDLRKGKYVEPAATTDELSVSLNLLGEKGGVYGPGKDIAFSFTTTKDAYVVVYNIDSEGYVHLLWPDDGNPTLTQGHKTIFVPAPGSDAHWLTGDKTGVEYIHAVAVPSLDRLKDEEVSFLAQNDQLPEGKRLRIDNDPYLAFNMIDEQIANNAETMPPATDYTYFYINREVEYPRYLCSQCHSPEKISDPYAEQCTEVVIEKAAYETEPHYPYPPLYDIRHAGEQLGAKDESDQSGGYSSKWLDNGNADANSDNTYLSVYGNYDLPYYGSYWYRWDPFYWDPFWWGFGWGWGGWYTPWWSFWGYPFGGCGFGFGGFGCGDFDNFSFDRHHGEFHYRPIYAERPVTRRFLDFGSTNREIRRTKNLADSRLVRSRNERLGSGLERSALERRTRPGWLDRGSAYRGNLGGARGSDVRDVKRRVVYGNDRGGSIDRTRGGNEGMRMPRVRNGQIDRSRGSDRGVIRRGASGREAAPQRETPSRERSHDSSTGRDRSSGSRGDDRSVNRPSAPSRDVPSRSVDRGSRSSPPPSGRGSSGGHSSSGGGRSSSGGGHSSSRGGRGR